MLLNFKNFLSLASQLVKSSEMQSSFVNEKLIRTVVCNVCGSRTKLNFHTDMPRMMNIEKLEIRKAAKREAEREKNLYIPKPSGIEEDQNSQMLPTHDLPDRLFDGIPFKDIPIVFIKCSKNNTILSLSDEGLVKSIRSCGQEGYKNSRKGTNIAAQTVGLAFGLRATKKNYKTIRVVLKGFGPGRLSAMKGLQLGGMNIISVTDATVDSFGPRPRKQRRL